MVPHKFPEISQGILPAEAQQQPAFEIVFQTFPFITPTAIIAEAPSPSSPNNQGRKLLQTPDPTSHSCLLPNSLSNSHCRGRRDCKKQLERYQILPETFPFSDYTQHSSPSFQGFHCMDALLGSANSLQHQHFPAL